MMRTGHTAIRPDRTSVFRAIVITDPHIASSAIPVRDAAYQAAITDAATYGAHRVLILGDVSQDSATGLTRSMAVAAAAMTDSTPPIRYIVGGHDLVDSGTPNSTNDAHAADSFGLVGPPFCWAESVVVGDLHILILGLEQNEYGGKVGSVENSIPGLAVGDRIGYKQGDPAGGSWRRFGPTQLAWVQSALLADRRADGILVMAHMPPAGVTCTDYDALGAILKADGRSAVILSGHTHVAPGVFTLAGNPALKFPELQITSTWTGNPWTRFSVGFSSGKLAVQSAEIHNAGDTGGWTPVAPFTVAA